jgi:hypothetical protein
LDIVSKYDRIITSPNILTETDNILNWITGEYKYLTLVKTIYKQTIEKYIKTEVVSHNWYLWYIGYNGFGHTHNGKRIWIINIWW